jgi:hypothetical protein
MQIQVGCVVCGQKWGVEEFDPHRRYACVSCRTVRCAGCGTNSVTLPDAPDGRSYICSSCAGGGNNDDGPTIGDVAANQVVNAAQAVLRRVATWSSAAKPSPVATPEPSHRRARIAAEPSASALPPTDTQRAASREQARGQQTSHSGGIERCSNCTGEVAAGSRFCNHCGQQLVPNPQMITACPDCKRTVSLDAARCPNCGTAGPFYPRDPSQALLRAIKAGDVAMVNTILHRGEVDVNINLTPIGGDLTTPLDAAEMYEQHAVVRLLRGLGGQRGDPDSPMTGITAEDRELVSSVVQSHLRRDCHPVDAGATSPRGKPKPARIPTTSGRSRRYTCMASGVITAVTVVINFCIASSGSHYDWSDAQTYTVCAASIIGSISLMVFTVSLSRMFFPRREKDDPFKNYAQLHAWAEPAFKAIVWLCVLPVVLWLIGSGYAIYLGFSAGPETGTGEIVGGIVSGVAALVGLAIVTIPIQRECPKCHRLLAAVPLNSELVGRDFETEAVTREDRHYTDMGKYIGSTRRQGQRLVQVDRHLNLFICRYCHHDWTSVTESRTAR